MDFSILFIVILITMMILVSMIKEGHDGSNSTDSILHIAEDKNSKLIIHEDNLSIIIPEIVRKRIFIQMLTESSFKNNGKDYNTIIIETDEEIITVGYYIDTVKGEKLPCNNYSVNLKIDNIDKIRHKLNSINTSKYIIIPYFIFINNKNNNICVTRRVTN